MIIINIINLYYQKVIKLSVEIILLNYQLKLSVKLSICEVSTITIKLPYVITNIYQNFGVRDVLGQIQNSMS